MPDIDVTLGSRMTRAYLVLPEGEGPHPGVVVFHEAWGLNDDIRGIADRFASEGYVALAPDLLEGGRIGCLLQATIDLRRGRGPLLDAALASVEVLAARPEADGDRVGAVGFCLGGGFAYLVGVSGKVKAVAPNYGFPPRDIERLAESCPVVASYGGKDRVMARYVGPVERVLSQAQVDHDVRLYSEAGHSFLNRPEGHRLARFVSRPMMTVDYHPEAAADAWRRIVAFFEEHV